MTTSNQRIVLDTNVIVSAVLMKQSVARQAFDKARTDGVLLLSPATLDELNSVLRREKFDKYLREEERLQFLGALVSEATFVEVTVTITDCRDPKDNKFLEVAVSGNADWIISGDQDLLILDPFHEISIISPRAFLEQQ